MARVIELGEYSDYAYAAIFPGLGLLSTDPEGAITLYRDNDKGPGFIVHKANSPITALACNHNTILMSCGETVQVNRYRPDLGKFDELSDTANECTLPHAVSALHILDGRGFLAGTDAGECYLFLVNLDDEIEIATPLPEPVLLGKLSDAITSLTSSETMVLITSQSGQVLLLDISSYFQPEKKPAEATIIFSTRLLCAELLQPGSISYVTRLGSALCGSDFLLPGVELALRSVSRPQAPIMSSALSDNDTIINLQYIVYKGETTPAFFSCVSMSQDQVCSVHFVRFTGKKQTPFLICCTQQFPNKAFIVSHYVYIRDGHTCRLIVIAASPNEGRTLHIYDDFYTLTHADKQALKGSTATINDPIQELTAQVLTEAITEPLTKKQLASQTKASKPSEFREDQSTESNSEFENDQDVVIPLGKDIIEQETKTLSESIVDKINPEGYNLLVERFADQVLQKVILHTGSSHTTSPALLVNFFVKLGSTTLRSWDFTSLSTRIEALGRSSRTFLCYTSKGSVQMSAFDNGTSFIIYCKSHTLGAREQTYTLPQPAIHASISDYGTAILRETSLSVYPYQDSPMAAEFKREWKAVFPPTLIPVACAFGDARFAAVSFTNRTLIAYCGGLVCYSNVYAHSITLLLMEGPILFVLSESTFYLIDLEARKTIVTGTSPVPPTHLIWGSIDEFCVFLYSQTGTLFALNIQSIFSSATYTWVPILSVIEQERKRISAIHNKIYRFYTSSDVPSISFNDMSALRPLFYFPVDVSLADLSMYAISTYALDIKGSSDKIMTVKHISTLLRGGKLAKTKSSAFLEELRKVFNSDLQRLNEYPLQARVSLPAMGEFDVTPCALSPVVNANDDDIDCAERVLVLREIALNALLACSTDEGALRTAEKQYDKEAIQYINLCLRAGLIPRACVALQLLRTRGAIEMGLQLFSIVGETQFVDSISTKLDNVFGQTQSNEETQLVRNTEVLPSGVSPFSTSSLWAIKSDCLSAGTSSAQIKRDSLEKQYKLMIAEMNEQLAILKTRARTVEVDKLMGNGITVLDEHSDKRAMLADVKESQEATLQVREASSYAPKSRSIVSTTASPTKSLASIFQKSK
ncbi:Hypothetical protein GLP15_2528 [Giardia lamblia P15]|uniref:Uncharacterized protein n=1 Tax=Giardia intestinalis (strain P15) TaxID=658858 RepID=E1EXC4_GIAIA|nr:Hypothetical protein GLP15_2528 [Giardia lamblia P15]